MEAEEEDADGVSRRLRSMHLAGPDLVEEESESAEVPVIVEQSVIAGPPPPLLFSLSSEPGQDETGTTVFDLSDPSHQASGVSESVVEITEDDVTSVIDTSDHHVIEEVKEEDKAQEVTAEASSEGQTGGEIPILSEETHTSETPAEAAKEEEKSTTEEPAKEEVTAPEPVAEGDADAAKEENAQHEEK
jgi:hypothetical protein